MDQFFASVEAINDVVYDAVWGLPGLILLIGTGIVLIPLALVRLVSGHVGQAVVCVILYACCAFLRELLEPRLIGKRAGIAPIAVVISVYAGIRLFGLWGILKGPLGLMIILQIWKSLQRREDGYREDNP